MSGATALVTFYVHIAPLPVALSVTMWCVALLIADSVSCEVCKVLAVQSKVGQVFVHGMFVCTCVCVSACECACVCETEEPGFASMCE